MTLSLTPINNRIPDICNLARCRQPADETLHLGGERLEVCEKHKEKVYRLMEAESMKRRTLNQPYTPDNQ